MLISSVVLPKGVRIWRWLLRRGFVDDHTNVDWGIVVGKSLLGSDNCSLKIMEFVTSEGLSIDVVFSLEYITSGELRQEVEVLEGSAFLLEQSIKVEESLKRGNPIGIRFNSCWL